MLSARGLQKRYAGERPVLDDVHVDIAPGSITALLGSNGCGKSTLLRSLALLETTDSGTVSVDGTEYHPADAGDFEPSPWPTVTMVFQQLFLWPHLTIRRNIALAQSRTSDLDAAERFADVVRAFELESLLERYPNEVSLGQRQRVALARAVAVRPRYLLLDEVTSALDIEHVTALLGYLKDLRRAGLGILLVTHLIGFAREAADRMLFMSAGRIVEEGDAGVLSAPRTPELTRFLAVLESSGSMSGRAPEAAGAGARS
jgi:ABC-type polar amino acid transport system ATPase subunit